MRSALLIVAILTIVPVVHAADDPPETGTSDPSTEETSATSIETSRSSLAQEIAELRASLAKFEEGDVAAEFGRKKLATLERIDGLLLRWSEQVELGIDLERATTEISERIAAGPEAIIGEPPPYSLSRVDALADAWKLASIREADRVEMVRLTGERLKQAGSALADSEKARRALLAVESNPEHPSEVESAARVLAQSLVEVRFAQIRQDLARSERDNANADLALQRLHAGIGAETLEWARERLQFDAADLDATTAEFEERTIQAREALDQAKVSLEAAERRLASAQSADATPEGAEKLEARRLARQAAQRRVAQIDVELERLAELRSLAERRHQLLAGERSRSELIEWEADAARFIDDIDRRRRLAEGRIEALKRRRTETLEAATADPDSDAARWRRNQASALEQLADAYQTELNDLGQSRTLAGRVREDIARNAGSLDVSDVIDVATAWVRDGWDTELVVVDDRSVTTGKILSALGLFVLGFVASRFASRMLRMALGRTSMDAGAAVAFQGLSFYLLLTLFFLLSLRTVGIPLTAFTVLGGGVAIGVGFGSQNVINNFLSGLILMAERPISVNDIVEVDDTYGQVEQIGARSTRIRTFDNIHIIVPNSAFLEKNVVNWTLSDDLVRTSVDVGVAYGSPTREVDRLINHALADHGKVLDQPEPVVLFTEFGDNSLMFRAVFWMRIRLMMDRRKVESDIRYRIDRLFREAGISIAFPQRDVHLDTTRPLEFRLAPPAEPDEAE